MTDKIKNFAHIHEFDDIGQVLVLMQGSDETGNPEVRVFAQPPGLGVCSVALGFSDDSDRSYEKQENAFKALHDPDLAKSLLDDSGMFSFADGGDDD